jgi:hypothetical protein
MPVAKQTVADAVLHLRHLRFERGRGRIALPAIGVARRLALEDGGEIARVAITVGDRDVQRLVQRAVLDAALAVGMEDRGGEASRRRVQRLVTFPSALQKAKTRSSRRTGLATAAGNAGAA